MEKNNLLDGKSILVVDDEPDVLDSLEECDCGLDVNSLPPGCNDINNDMVPAPCPTNCTLP